MAAAGPARAAIQEGRMVATADENLTSGRLLLEVALEAEVRVTRLEHLRVWRTVGRMANDAAFAGRFVFEGVGHALGGVASDAGIVVALERRGRPLGNGCALVRIVAIGAAHFAIGDGMTAREAEFAAFVEVALVTNLGRLTRVDNAATLSALHVKAGRTVATLAAHGLLALRAFQSEAAMC